MRSKKKRSLAVFACAVMRLLLLTLLPALAICGAPINVRVCIRSASVSAEDLAGTTSDPYFQTVRAPVCSAVGLCQLSAASLANADSQQRG